MKRMLWDKIKEIGGDNPSDIMADIKVADSSVYARHTVKSGETLGLTRGKITEILECTDNSSE